MNFIPAYDNSVIHDNYFIINFVRMARWFLIISYTSFITLAVSKPISTQIKDFPFAVNSTINRVSFHNVKLPSMKSFKPVLTDEFLIDTNVIYVPNVYPFPTTWNPSITFDGSNYLVVWQDWRNYADVYCSRVSQSGEILDPAGIPITTTGANPPSVAFDGTNYFIVWSEEKEVYPYDEDIYGVRVNQLGIILDTSKIVISNVANSDQSDPKIAYDGFNYFVVWWDYRGGGNIYGSRINQDGVVLDPYGIAISTAINYQGLPAVAFDGSNYLVVWGDQRNSPEHCIYCARVTTAGSVIDTSGIYVSGNEQGEENPSVAFDGTNYLIAWEDWRNYPEQGDIYGTRISTDGIILDTTDIAISTAHSLQCSPKVAFDGINYFVAWYDCRNCYSVYGARVNQLGIVLDSTGIEITTSVSGWLGHLSVVFGDTNYLVLWNDIRLGYNNIFGSRVSKTGLVLDTGFNISTTGNSQELTSGAFDGTNYLIVWQDDRNWTISMTDIYGIRLSSNGVALDNLGIPISTANDCQRSPEVAFDGTNYLVVWEDERNRLSTWSDIYCARVTQSGVIIDTSGIAVSNAEYSQKNPAIAFDGNNYLIVWEDYRNEIDYPDLYGARVSRDGIILDPEGIPVSTGLIEQWQPAITFDGTNYLVVWFDRRQNDSSGIYCARISPSGVVLDPTGVFIDIARNGWQPKVTFDGTNYLVVWSNDDIYGARVNQYGIVLDTSRIAIATGPEEQYNPSLNFDGTYYLIAWENNSRTGYRPYDSDVYGAKLNSTGVIIDSFYISTQNGNQFSPALVRGDGNQLLITYSGFTNVVNDRPYNTMRIWGKFHPFPGVEKSNSEVRIQSAKLFEVYPNPAKSVMRVRYPWSGEEKTDLKIFDVSGTLVKVEKVTSLQSHKQEVRISLKGINPGIYFLRLGEETKKFIVAK